MIEDIDVDQLKIVHHPDPVLREKAAPIEAVTDKVAAIAEKMIKLMHEAPGVGLAAPQVGLAIRMFVANPTGEEGDDRVYINPELYNPSSEKTPADEGCLSLPEITVRVNRPEGISIKALNEAGDLVEDRATELLARIWQHENDHLNGVLILDYMDASDTRYNRKALKALMDKARAK